MSATECLEIPCTAFEIAGSEGTMKQNDTGGFCMLYVESADERATVLQAIDGQKKPVVILLAEHSRAFQRPEDFATLKHIKRQADVSIVFVIPHGGHLVQLATRNGFPVYLSMDALAEALAAGRVARTRSLNRPSGSSDSLDRGDFVPKRTVPLPETLTAPAVSPRKTRKLADLDPLPTNSMTNSTTNSGTHHVTGNVAPTNVAPSPLPRKTGPLATSAYVKKTEPLAPPQRDITRRRTVPLQPPPAQLTPAPLAPPKSNPGSFLPKVLAILVIFAVAIGGLGSFLLFYQKVPDVLPVSAAAPVVLGRVSFLSSGQLSENSNQGINDEVLVELHNLPNPVAQKSYYGWLLGDKKQSDEQAILLGVLRINQGSVRLLYPGDAAHTNLLAITSRFLITEEDSAVMPISPTPDYNAWRFYGEIPQTPLKEPGDTQNFSYLDHLRHLLAADPTLDQMELPGGLNNWLYRNTSKVLEWMSSTREPWEDSKDVGLLRRQTIRALSYLDGISYVKQDLPPNTPSMINDRLARIGLLEVNGPTQDPPGYLTHIVHHLNGLLQAPGATPELRKNVADIVMALNNAKYWLTRLRMDAQKLVKMTDAQLRQPATLNLINDMIDNATNAYSGEIDPASGQMREGVSWLHDHMQLIANFSISPFTANSQSIQMIQDAKHAKA
jgi:hypothetical protein